MRNTSEAREYRYITVLNLGIGSHCLVDNIGSIGPGAFASSRVCNSGVRGFLRLHPIILALSPAASISMI